jgi:hypothetical protein
MYKLRTYIVLHMYTPYYIYYNYFRAAPTCTRENACSSHGFRFQIDYGKNEIAYLLNILGV